MEMDKKGSAVWLIIFLCAIAFGLAWLVNYNKHLQKINLLNQEIEKLNQRVEEVKKEKEEEIKKLKESFSSPSTTSSATPTSTPSAILEFKVATKSGERE